MPARPSGPARRSLAGLVTLTLAGGTVALATAPAGAVEPASPAATQLRTADLPPQEPGVTLRTYDLRQGIDQLCRLKDGQTPNIDKLMPTVDWTEASQFGLEDHFLTHVVGNVHAPEDGEYTFRLTSDDGSRLSIGGDVVVDNDGLHGEESVDGTVTLTAGAHPLFVEFFEDAYGQVLRLEWMPPGATEFTVVPQEALSTEADVVRVTAPGTKYCEGAEDTAGDGLPLDAVHPGYDLTDLRPEGFEPMVSGMDWTADGDLVVATSGSVSPGGWVEDPEPGELFVLDQVTGETSAEEVTATKIATDLFNPMGVAVIDDSIFVTERDALTELTDPDGDGFYDQRSTVAEWPFGGNFHEFAFGLLHDEDHFYVNLSVAINNGGATTDPQPAENRGTSITVDRETGEIDYVAGGLRTPNGMTFGPEDELFVMDNQGAWLPSSKLVHVEQDRFFNHYTNPDGPFDDQPVTQPALWIPQNEIGNSPSEPVQLSEGRFAGQLLFGDVTYGGLQRGFLEKVDGDFQGAVFRHTAGLEAGVNRTVIGPDGAVYVGGIGEAGNWSEPNKLRYGLQKLTPNGQESFDMLEMRVQEGGFEVEYSQPLSDETVAKIADDAAQAYRVDQWRYVPTQQYGGPKIDEEVLHVSDATVSEDGTTVSLSVDGLKPGRVVHLRSPRPFSDAEGRELWNTEAWYTLNSLPGYVAPADRGYYEAEESVLLGSAGLNSEHSGYSGSGFVDGIQSPGAGVTFTVDADAAGTQPVNLRYANGPNPFEGDKSISVLVNGTEVDPWVLPSTGDWKTWDFATRDLDLREGGNTITLRFDEGDDGNVNLDVLSIGENPDLCAPSEPDEGYTALFDGTLASFDDWRLAGAGSFGRQDDCTLEGAGGMGLLWHTEELQGSYSLQLDWKLVKDDNGGVFVGFPDPGDDPWVAVDQGYEIQIDASDEPDRTTGAVYTFQGADPEAVEEALNPVPEWNSYDIRVQGDTIQIYLNDVLVNDFTSTDPARDLSHGFLGVQNHGAGETVFYRDIQVKPLSDVPATATPEVSVTQPDCEAGTSGSIAGVPVEGVERYVLKEWVDGAAGGYVPAGEVEAGTYVVRAWPAEGTELELSGDWEAIFKGRAQLVVEIEDCAPEHPVWDASTVYTAGDRVTHEGAVFEATWWTRDAEPGSSPWGSWQEIASTDDGTAVWTESRIFVAGDVVEHDGATYTARWWTRNQQPGGSPWGPWELTA
ncbi:family 16 glycoside hydrolase [Isoptericola halotolerans]|uniref:family 16 glycoside hydrolase n=1 Tax=Isoptericola halotolerans TaxID=300560 RepID=UPI00388E8F4E